MEPSLSVILIADQASRDSLLAVIAQAGLGAPAPAATAAELQHALAPRPLDLLLLADSPVLPGLGVAEVAGLARRLEPPPPLIVLSESLAGARAALAAGAQDAIVVGPHEADGRLALAVRRTLRAAADDRAERWAARAVAASHDHYQQLFTLSRSARLLLDPAGGRILEANPAAAALFGRGVSDLAGLPFAELCLGPADPLLAGLAAAAAAPDGAAFVCRQAVPDGEARDLEVQAAPVELGQRRLLEATVRDLTGRGRDEWQAAALSQLGAALRGTASRADLLAAVVAQVALLLGVDAVALVLPAPLSGEPAIEQAQHWPEPAGTRHPAGAGLGGRVIASGQPLSLDLPSSAAAELGLREPGPLRAAAAVPLAAQDQVIGALCVAGQAPLTAAQTHLLSAMADLAAAAIQRTTLHEKVEQRVQRLAALHAIDVAIASSFDLRVTLNIFLDHLMGQLGVDAGAVLLLNDAAQSLHYAAVRGLSAGVVHQPSPRLSHSPPGRVVLQGQSLFLRHLAETRGPGAAHPPSGEVFASYYGVPLIARGRVLGVLEVFQRTLLDPDADWVEYLHSLATQAAIAIDNATLFNELQRSNLELNLAYEATIESWARMLEARGIEAGGHNRRVADRAVQLGRRAGFSDTELLHLRRGALLHDIGMLGVPEAVVLKATTYSSADYSVIRQHPIYGFEILAPIAYLRPAIDIPYAHHERWDGSGYPRRLSGERIPLPARLFAVVDVWDALVTERPYRPAWPEDNARRYLRDHAGTLFDPHAVELFLQNGHESLV